jgi:hypothetical protein
VVAQATAVAQVLVVLLIRLFRLAVVNQFLMP